MRITPLITGKIAAPVQSVMYKPNFYTLRNAQGCDTISFGNTMNKLPLYYEYTGQSYNPATAQEKSFADALRNFSELDKHPYSQDEFQTKSKSLATTCNDLMIDILDSEENDVPADEKKVYVFSSLVEALDKAKTGEIASSLTDYLYNNFLESYWGEPFLLEPLKVYAESDILRRPSVKMHLKSLYERWQ